MNHFRTFSFLGLGLLLSLNAFAQTPTGYQPTVLPSLASTERLFSQMPEGFKEEGGLRSESQCFHRAEIWTYDFHRNEKIDAMKVFIFYTYAFKQAYLEATGNEFSWWFHVAPYVLAQSSNQAAPDEWVMDKTYLDKPADIATWANLFATLHTRCDEDRENCTRERFADDKPCKEGVPYTKFIDEVSSEHPVYGKEFCYIVKTPASLFHPEEIADFQAGKTKDLSFDLGDVQIALDSAPVRSRKGFFEKRLGF